jgi:hypothetical protein
MCVCCECLCLLHSLELDLQLPMVCLMVFKATFNNISVISWRSVLLMEEIGGSGEDHRPVAITDKLYHIMLYTCQCNVLSDHHCVLEIIWSVISWYLSYHLSFPKKHGVALLISLSIEHKWTWSRCELTTSVLIGTDYIGSCKSNSRLCRRQRHSQQTHIVPLNWPPRYNWNIVESGLKHHQTNKQTST